MDSGTERYLTRCLCWPEGLNSSNSRIDDNKKYCTAPTKQSNFRKPEGFRQVVEFTKQMM